jgi:hypothetical protein
LFFCKPPHHRSPGSVIRSSKCVTSTRSR